MPYLRVRRSGPVVAAWTLAATLPVSGGPPAAATDFSISGTVTYEGEPLKRYPLRMDADPNCAAMYEGKRVLSRDSLVGDDGTVQNVFVYLREAPEDAAGDKPAEAVRLEQRGCLYTPRIIGVRVEQNIEIVNDDPTLHNVRALARANRPFNIGQPARGTRTKSFRVPEKPIQVKCDVHPWMSAYVFVMEHSFHSTTGRDGKYRIDALPAGSYELVFWHEKLGEQTVEVEVTADVEGLNLTFEGSE
ncbi:MAG: hypothetical protein OXH32_16545 [Acidobacteria bacterium]|nr:hypothetical protein [Acidobacteriota bacterium]